MGSIGEAFIIASGDDGLAPVSVETNGLKALKFECGEVEMLLRWKNGLGLLGPAWQIKITKSK